MTIIPWWQILLWMFGLAALSDFLRWVGWT